MYPNPVRAALLAEKSGADSITIHLREDRRHIRDYDLNNIKKKLKIPLNLEIAPTKEMLKIALKSKPNYVCIVPEKRKEVTTEGGLNIKKNKKFLKLMIKKLTKNKIRVSLFVEPKIQDIKFAKLLGVNCVELHTGKFCRFFENKKKRKKIFLEIKNAAFFANYNGIEVHAGHGLTYNTASYISMIKNISELNIGHFIISESLFLGMNKVVEKFRKVIKN